MSRAVIKKITDGWIGISHLVFVPHTEQEYHQIVVLPDALIDEGGKDETHPFASLMDILGTLIEKYEDVHVPELDDMLMSNN